MQKSYQANAQQNDEEEPLPITRVWRNGGLSAKFNVSNSITA